jgi:hypothetical protein
MNEIQELAAYVPYMVAPGNHERAEYINIFSSESMKRIVLR